MSSRQTKKKRTGDIGKLLTCVGEYKKATLLSPLCMVGEVSMEILIPFLMAKIIDVGIANGDLPYVAKVGLFMVLMAVLSLGFGCDKYTTRLCKYHSRYDPWAVDVDLRGYYGG